MLPASVRIFVCTAPQDMRRSFDTLALTAQQVVGEDPQGGSLFVFLGRRANRIKVLWWDQNGYCLLYKRVHGARFVVSVPPTGATAVLRIDAAALAQLLKGVPKERKRHTQTDVLH